MQFRRCPGVVAVTVAAGVEERAGLLAPAVEPPDQDGLEERRLGGNDGRPCRCRLRPGATSSAEELFAALSTD